VRSNRTIGMSRVRFGELLRRVGELVVWDKKVGRPRALTLAQALRATLMYFKNNLTQEVIAELLSVARSVISDTIAFLEGVIEDALEDCAPDLDQGAADLGGEVAVIDGSLHPCWSWKEEKGLWSGKHGATGHQHQYVCDLKGRLRYVSDPLPGRTHDAKAFKDLGPGKHFDGSNAFADKGYIGCGVTTPSRKPVGKEMPEDQKDFNKTVNQHRYVVERAIANFKTWRCLHIDYRRPVQTYPAAFRAVRSLYFFKLNFR
jgi:hypothetical protein